MTTQSTTHRASGRKDSFPPTDAASNSFGWGRRKTTTQSPAHRALGRKIPAHPPTPQATPSDGDGGRRRRNHPPTARSDERFLPTHQRRKQLLLRHPSFVRINQSILPDDDGTTTDTTDRASDREEEILSDETCIGKDSFPPTSQATPTAASFFRHDQSMLRTGKGRRKPPSKREEEICPTKHSFPTRNSCCFLLSSG